MAINHSVLWTCAAAARAMDEKSDTSHLKCVSLCRACIAWHRFKWKTGHRGKWKEKRTWNIDEWRFGVRQTAWHAFIDTKPKLFFFLCFLRAKWTIICGVMNKWCIYSISKVVTNHLWLSMKYQSFSHHFTAFVSRPRTMKMAFSNIRLHRIIFIFGKMFCDHRSKVKPNRQCRTNLRYWWRWQKPTFVCKTLSGSNT